MKAAKKGHELTIKERWERISVCIPDEATANQAEQLRWMFYAGAYEMFQLGGALKELNENQVFAAYETVFKEMETFIDDNHARNARGSH